MASRWLLVLAISLAAIGCSSSNSPPAKVDRAQQLIGKWKTNAESIAKVTPAPSEEERQVLQSLVVELHKDNTFTGAMSGSTLTGDWTFDKESSEVVMTGTKLVGPAQQVASGPAPSWTGYLSENGQELNFYPVSPEGARRSRESGKGKSIALQK